MATAPGRREQNKAANRETILRAAQRVFIESGYEAVTIRDVVRQTDLAAGTFYNYFPDKESLFRALIEHHIGPYAQRMHAARADAATLEDFVCSGYAVAFREARSNPGFFAMLFRNEPVMRTLFNEQVIGVLVGALHEDLRVAVARGLLPDLDLDYLSAAVFGIGYEMMRVLVSQPDRDPDEAARFAARMVLTGIFCQQPAEPAPGGTH